MRARIRVRARVRVRVGEPPMSLSEPADRLPLFLRAPGLG